MTIVVDASVAIAWLFKSERTPTVRQVLRNVAREGAVVPAIWRLEIANALRTAVRKRRCDNIYAKRSISRFARLPISADAQTDQHAWGETLQLSRKYDLTPYDAAYLELAIRLGHPLASCDAALVQAARRCALKVVAGP